MSAAAVVTAILKVLYVIMQVVVEIWNSPVGELFKDWYGRQGKRPSIQEIF